MFFHISNQTAVMKLLYDLNESLQKQANQPKPPYGPNPVIVQTAQTVSDRFSRIQKIIKESTHDKAHYIKCNEAELEKELPVFIDPLIEKNNMMFVAFLGRGTNPPCKSKIEKVTKKAVKTIVFPTGIDDSSIRMFALFSKKSSYRLEAEIDCSAIYLLDYYD